MLHVTQTVHHRVRRTVQYTVHIRAVYSKAERTVVLYVLPMIFLIDCVFFFLINHSLFLNQLQHSWTYLLGHQR